MKNIVTYFGQLYTQGKARIDNVSWNILHQELELRNKFITDPTITYPSHWTADRESPVQLPSETTHQESTTC